MTLVDVDRRPTHANGKRKTTRMNPRDKRARRRALLRRDGHTCWWCGAPFTEQLQATFDHLRPLRWGGTDAQTNLVLACGPCNNNRANPRLGYRNRTPIPFRPPAIALDVRTITRRAA